ncbi:MAG: GNAT family N-acetyltransferase [Chloroflexi bacterium]|nr:GNAT family N-acetyltransferase [Chloroflexota bacterium]
MSSSALGPAYRIHTPRLVIRCWNPEDAPLLKAAVDESREHLKPWMPWVSDEPEDVQSYVESLRQFRGKFDLGQDFVYAIFDRGETQVLGGTGLHTRIGKDAREIGYWIHRDHTNQGLATETSAALVKVAFEIEKVRRLEIHCDPENVRSAAVPKKLGFTLEAVLRERVLFREQWRDVMIWTLFAEAYPSSLAAGTTVQAFDAAGRQIL